MSEEDIYRPFRHYDDIQRSIAAALNFSYHLAKHIPGLTYRDADSTANCDDVSIGYCLATEEIIAELRVCLSTTYQSENLLFRLWLEEAEEFLTIGHADIDAPARTVPLMAALLKQFVLLKEHTRLLDQAIGRHRFVKCRVEQIARGNPSLLLVRGPDENHYIEILPTTRLTIRRGSQQAIFGRLRGERLRQKVAEFLAA